MSQCIECEGGQCKKHQRLEEPTNESLSKVIDAVLWEDHEGGIARLHTSDELKRAVQDYHRKEIARFERRAFCAGYAIGWDSNKYTPQEEYERWSQLISTPRESLRVLHGAANHSINDPCDVCKEAQDRFQRDLESGEVDRIIDKYTDKEEDE